MCSVSRKLYDSVHTQIFSLPDDTEVYPAHDYKVRNIFPHSVLCVTWGPRHKPRPHLQGTSRLL